MSENGEFCKKVLCAFSGKKGAYAEQAVERYFGSKADSVPCNSFKEVFKSVSLEKTDFGMIPIENSLGGSVYDNYDNLVAFKDISIVGALHLRIQHALLATEGSSLKSIKRVYSHPQGFAQCSKLIESEGWEKIAATSTATAAKMVSDFASPENAAIASAVTAKYYNLKILMEDIQDDPQDFTRFVVICKNKNIKTLSSFDSSLKKEPNVASFVFGTPNKTGALYNALGVFQKNKLNLTRLESRPIIGQPWHYWFYVDAELNESALQNESYVQAFMSELQNVAEDVRLLGVYSETRSSL